MADKKTGEEIKNVEQVRKDEEKVNKLAAKVHQEIDEGMEGRPYLFVLASLHEIGREGKHSKVAAQLNWRCNLDAKMEGKPQESVEATKSLAKFLAEQLDRVANDQQIGVKKKYNID